MNQPPDPKNRTGGMRARLALIIVGLALGFAARWIGGILEDRVREPHFKPMPPESISNAIDDPQQDPSDSPG